MDEFEEKIAKHKNEFFRFVLRNVWDSSVAEDVFSTAVVAAYDSRKKYTPGTNFRAWMFRILTNKCFVANRETSRAFDRLEETNAHLAVAKEPSIHRDVAKAPKRFLEECGDEVYKAFRKLSTAQRTCILLRDVERFSYKEIAEIMVIPVGTVMTHLARGRKKLREDLLQYARDMGIVRTLAPIERKSRNEGEEQQGSALSS